MDMGGTRTLLVCGALVLLASGCVRPDPAATGPAASGGETTTAGVDTNTASAAAPQATAAPPTLPATTAPPLATPPPTAAPVAPTPATAPPATPPVTARPTVTVQVTTAAPVTARPPVTVRAAAPQSFPSCTNDSSIALASRDPGYQQSAELVQRRLVQLGYDPGMPDGFIGPDTLAALESWAYDSGYGNIGYVYEYGEIDWVMIDNLGLNCSTSTSCYLEVDPGVPIVYSETARAVQRRLSELGYDPGALDGYMGPTSQTALERWGADGYDRIEYWGEAGGYNISESGFRELGIYC